MALPYLNANPAIDLKLTMVDGVIEFMEASSDGPSGAILSAVRTAHHMPPFPTYPALVGTYPRTSLPAHRHHSRRLVEIPSWRCTSC